VARAPRSPGSRLRVSMARLVRPLLAVLVLALAVAGCGRGEGVKTTAETEGLYLDIAGLKYQVQLSRYMNPNDVEDRDYLAGLAEGTAEPGADEVWFGVWVRVQNTSGEAREAADTWEIHDTQENVYRPVPLDNVFAFRPGPIPPQTVVPLPNSAAGQGPVQGSLLLFKIKVDSFQNRPLELIFSNGPQGQTGTYALDV
jgi:hypothetical protein